VSLYFWKMRYWRWSLHQCWALHARQITNN